MGGARALIASLGASISLVAGAALALLVVSFVFAYDGLSGNADVAISSVALRVQGQPTSASERRGDGTRRVAAVVIATPAPQAAPAAPRRARPSRGLRESSGVQTRPAPVAQGVGNLGAAPDPATSNPAASKPATGDGVRDLGDSVSATVQDTGDAAGGAAAPLGPPVTQAVQNVLNLIDSLLQGATDGLAGTLDKTLPR